MITKLPASASVKENDNFNLICESDGMPNSGIQWFKGGMSVMNDGTKYSIVSIVVSEANGVKRIKSTLTIKGATKEDAGVYKCQSTNTAGSAESSTNVGVETVTPPAPKSCKF